MNTSAKQPTIETAITAAGLLGDVERLRSSLGRLLRSPERLTRDDVQQELREAVAACDALNAGIREFTVRLSSTSELLATERIEREQADARFLFAYGASPFSMSIATLKEGRFVDVNDSFLRRLGYERDEVIGKTSTELNMFPDPAGREWLTQALAEKGYIDGIEFDVRTKSGEIKRGRIYSRIIMHHGEPCILSITQNVEELREAREEVERLRQFYENLMRDLPAQIAVFDTAGRYLYISPNSVTDPSLRDWLLNKTDFDYCARRNIDPEIAEARAKWIAGAAESKETVTGEERFVSHTGEVRYFIRKYAPVIDTSGHVTHVIGYGLDITDYRNLEEQLQRAQKMEAIGRLAGGIAHDFNNLLTAMLGITDFLRPHVKENETVEAGIDEIKKTAERAAALTRQLLTFSRRQTTQQVPIDVNQVIGGFEDMMRRLVGRQVTLVIERAAELPCVMANANQLEQVLMNLVVNARDAMPEGGRLTISTRIAKLAKPLSDERALDAPSEYVIIGVRDTGVGMDDETKARIFEPFFTTKEEGKGTGLGLSTAYAIVQRFGGNIGVESSPGEGTSFNIYLPCPSAPKKSAGEDASEDEKRDRLETVLVVEDEKAVREVVRRILVRSGYTVLEASSGKEALEIAARHEGPIDVLVSDIMMPGMLGLELAAKLREHRNALRVLFMSGHYENLDPEVVRLLNPRNFIPKPFTAGALASKVRETLDDPIE